MDGVKAGSNRQQDVVPFTIVDNQKALFLRKGAKFVSNQYNSFVSRPVPECMDTTSRYFWYRGTYEQIVAEMGVEQSATWSQKKWTETSVVSPIFLG
eukprot:scaffold10098_cov96-Cylindrotheca_fusiformis.AAC.1